MFLFIGNLNFYICFVAIFLEANILTLLQVIAVI